MLSSIQPQTRRHGKMEALWYPTCQPARRSHNLRWLGNGLMAKSPMYVFSTALSWDDTKPTSTVLISCYVHQQAVELCMDACSKLCEILRERLKDTAILESEWRLSWHMFSELRQIILSCRNFVGKRGQAWCLREHILRGCGDCFVWQKSELLSWEEVLVGVCHVLYYESIYVKAIALYYAQGC